MYTTRSEWMPASTHCAVPAIVAEPQLHAFESTDRPSSCTSAVSAGPSSRWKM